MLLAIDVGNTQTHLGAFQGDELAEHWRFRTVAGATGDEIAERIAGLLALSGIEVEEVEALVVSSVVPPLGGQYEAMAAPLLRRPLPAGRPRGEDRDADPDRQPATRSAPTGS